MERTRVKSSNIKSIGYDPEALILEVEFLNKTLYHYFDVPLVKYLGIMDADSHGTFLNEYIKPFHHYKKIR